MSDPSAEITEKLTSCKLPPLPAIIQEIIQLTQDIYADPYDVANLVKVDLSLSASVLKIANSVAFGYAGSVSSIEEGISRIGISRIRDMVLSVSLIKDFRTVNGLDFQQFWLHSLAVAFASEIIEKNARNLVKPSNHTYTAGLLHKIGIVLLAQNFTPEYEKIIKEVKKAKRELWEIEIDLIGVSHTQASGHVFSEWNLPEIVRDVAVHYNDPINAPDKSKELVYIVHLANFACLNQGIGAGIDLFPISFYDKAWETIGMQTDDIPQILTAVHDLSKTAKGIIELAK